MMESNMTHTVKIPTFALNDWAILPNGKLQRLVSMEGSGGLN